MNWLVGLYPTSWRARYEEELRALLTDRPPSVRDRIDLVRGAFDAHLHADLVGPGRDAVVIPWVRRRPGLFALAGGAVWVAMLLIVGVALGRGEEPDITGLFWLSILVMAIGLLGSNSAAEARSVKRGLAASALLFGAGLVLPWEAKVIPALPLVILVGAGMLWLAATRAGLSTRIRRRVVAIGFLLPSILIAPVGGGLYEPSPWFALAILLPYGLAWMLVGALTTLRGVSGPTNQPSGVPSEATA